MESVSEHLWQLETWLREGKMMRRAGSRESLSTQDFEKQRKGRVRYAVFCRVTGTFSDGRGDARPAYRRLE